MTSRDELIRELFEIRAHKKSLETAEKDILSALALSGKDTFSSGPYLVSVTPTVRFNADLAKTVLNKTEYAKICKPVPQSAAAKAMFPEKYERMQKVSGSTVTVKFNEEA